MFFHYMLSTLFTVSSSGGTILKNFNLLNCHSYILLSLSPPPPSYSLVNFARDLLICEICNILEHEKIKIN
jgi:hypothetical protein